MRLIFSSKFFLVLFLSLTIVSCVSEKTQQKALAIGQLQTQVDSCSKEFKTLDLEKIKTYKTNAKSQLDFLEKNFHDTNFQSARYIDVYYRNYKLMTKIIKGADRLQSEITYSQSQLEKLHNDVENGFFTDSLYQEYFDGEQKAVEKIKNTTKVLSDWETKSIHRYDGMTSSIDSVITELQNQGYR